jgi:hypothetical protein
VAGRRPERIRGFIDDVLQGIRGEALILDRRFGQAGGARSVWTAACCLGTPDLSGLWGWATSVARVCDDGGRKSAYPRCRLKSAYPGARRAACAHLGNRGGVVVTTVKAGGRMSNCRPRLAEPLLEDTPADWVVDELRQISLSS